MFNSGFPSHTWSDKVAQEYNYSNLPFGVCPNCDRIIWTYTAKYIKDQDIWFSESEDPTFTDLSFLNKPTIEDCHIAIAEKTWMNCDEEKILRIFTIQKNSDSIREIISNSWNEIVKETNNKEAISSIIISAIESKTEEFANSTQSPEAISNLENTLPLLNTELMCDRIIMAEIMRQLGRFEHSAKVASNIVVGNCSSITVIHFCQVLSWLCEMQDSVVRPISAIQFKLRLSVISVDDKPLKTRKELFPIQKYFYKELRRSQFLELNLNDDQNTISELHAEIIPCGNAAYFYNDTSASGTYFVNKNTHLFKESILLQNNDRLKIGKYEVLVEFVPFIDLGYSIQRS
jgi:hypothetical protein